VASVTVINTFKRYLCRANLGLMSQLKKCVREKETA